MSFFTKTFRLGARGGLIRLALASFIWRHTVRTIATFVLDTNISITRKHTVCPFLNAELFLVFIEYDSAFKNGHTVLLLDFRSLNRPCLCYRAWRRLLGPSICFRLNG